MKRGRADQCRTNCLGLSDATKDANGAFSIRASGACLYVCFTSLRTSESGLCSAGRSSRALRALTSPARLGPYATVAFLAAASDRVYALEAAAVNDRHLTSCTTCANGIADVRTASPTSIGPTAATATDSTATAAATGSLTFGADRV